MSAGKTNNLFFFSSSSSRFSVYVTELSRDRKKNHWQKKEGFCGVKSENQTRETFSMTKVQNWVVDPETRFWLLFFSNRSGGSVVEKSIITQASFLKVWSVLDNECLRCRAASAEAFDVDPTLPCCSKWKFHNAATSSCTFWWKDSSIFLALEPSQMLFRLRLGSNLSTQREHFVNHQRRDSPHIKWNRIFDTLADIELLPSPIWELNGKLSVKVGDIWSNFTWSFHKTFHCV